MLDVCNVCNVNLGVLEKDGTCICDLCYQRELLEDLRMEQREQM